MNLKVNGESKEIETASKEADLCSIIQSLGYQQGLVVVEFNGQIRPRSTWDQENVKDGDTLEIVTIVGGGS